MCVAQFREYTQAFAYKLQGDMTGNDIAQKQRGTFYDHGVFHYTMNKKKMERLKQDGNPYALNHEEEV